MSTTVFGDVPQVSVGQRKDGRAYVKGLAETRRKMLEMGVERNLFEKWIKESSLIVAKEATKTAPRISGGLALSIRGFASKRWTQQSRTTRGLEKRYAFGGVITSGSPARVPYARAVSFGMYHKAGDFAKANNSKNARRQWRETVRGRGNPFMVKAREAKRHEMIELLNRRIRYWIKLKGFETNGL